MPTGDRVDPYRSFNFRVEIDGITRAGFRECTGLDSTTDAVDYREGGDGLTVRKLPGLVKHSNITLKRGLTDDKDLYEWRLKAATGEVERREGSIVLLDDKGEEKMRWNFKQAWPSKWTGPTFNATGNEIGIETLELVHEGLERA
jgi:phage tail-like protein